MWCMSGHVVVMKLPITSCPLAVAFWIIWIVSTEECSSLMQNLMQIHCSSDSVILKATATQYTLSLNSFSTTPLTSTVKLSLFTHAHSSPLSLAARLHQCHTNHSSYINYGWTFSGQTLYSQIYRYICTQSANMHTHVHAIVNIMRMVCMTSMEPGRQGEWTSMHMREQWQLHCTSQWGW